MSQRLQSHKIKVQSRRIPPQKRHLLAERAARGPGGPCSVAARSPGRRPPADVPWQMRHTAVDAMNRRTGVRYGAGCCPPLVLHTKASFKMHMSRRGS